MNTTHHYIPEPWGAGKGLPAESNVSCDAPKKKRRRRKKKKLPSPDYADEDDTDTGAPATLTSGFPFCTSTRPPAAQQRITPSQTYIEERADLTDDDNAPAPTPRRIRRIRKRRPATIGTQSTEETSTADSEHTVSPPIPAYPSSVPNAVPADPTLNSLKRTFYERLTLLHALDPVQGDRAEHLKTADLDNLDRESLRREFLNSIAYVCDTHKGGKTCTAAALQETFPVKRLLLASNSPCIPVRTIRSVEEILGKLGNHPAGDASADQKLETYLLGKMVELSGPWRMKQYLKMLWIDYSSCRQNDGLIKMLGNGFLQVLDYLESIFATVQRLNRALGVEDAEKFDGTTNSADALRETILRCYKLAKRSKQMSQLQTMSQQGPLRNEPFKKLRHGVGRLAKFLAVAKVLTKTAKAHPQLFLDLTVVSVANHGTWAMLLEPLPAPGEPGDAESTVKRIILEMEDHNLVTADQYFDKLCEFNRPSAHDSSPGSSVIELFEKSHRAVCCTPKASKLLLHAEVLLLEYIRTIPGFTFVDNDRFIGVSKLTCYLCDRYFASVIPNIETLATHNKIYHRWALPENTSERMQKEWWRSMAWRLAEQVRTLLDERMERRYGHTDSTTGVTTPSEMRSDLDSLSLSSAWSDRPEFSDEEEHTWSS